MHGFKMSKMKHDMADIQGGKKGKNIYKSRTNNLKTTSLVPYISKYVPNVKNLTKP